MAEREQRDGVVGGGESVFGGSQKKQIAMVGEGRRFVFFLKGEGASEKNGRSRWEI